MDNDYKQVELEVKSYEIGFNDGVEQGIVGGQIRGIDYLINLLTKMKLDLLGIEEEDTPNADN